MKSTIETPVFIQIFNRPLEVSMLVDALRVLTFRKIIIAADGPRDHVEGESAACFAARNKIRELKRCAKEWQEIIYEENLGNASCAYRSLTTAFGQHDKLIVLEDDCIPHPDFFRWSEVALREYESDERVGHVNGTQMLLSYSSKEKVSFSRYISLWGWAGWRRSWAGFTGRVDAWRGLRDTDWIEGLLNDSSAAVVWRERFDRVLNGKEAWDWALTFYYWQHGMLSVTPPVNLVRNVGFNADATHTRHHLDHRAELPYGVLPDEIAFPEKIEADGARDRAVLRSFYKPGFIARVRHRVRLLAS